MGSNSSKTDPGANVAAPIVDPVVDPVAAPVVDPVAAPVVDPVAAPAPATSSYFPKFPNFSNFLKPSEKPSEEKGGNHEKVVVVKLWAKWCGHCQAFEPEWKKLVHQYSKNPNVIFEHLEEKGMEKGGMEKLNHKYGNRINEPNGFPTFYIFRSLDTKKQLPYHGERTFEGMKKEIEKLLMHVRKGHHNATVKKGGAKKKKANKTMHSKRR